MIEIKNLEKKFSKNVILSNCNIDFDINCKTALIGVNGAGKTVFSKCIMGIEKYDGLINLNSSKIVMCFSDNILPMYLSIYEIFIQMDWDMDKLEYFLKKLHCSNEKYTMIKDLSYGTQKKMNIIFTLFLDSDFIIFDEITNGLDINSLYNLVDILNDMKKGMLIISHDFNFINDVCSKYTLLKGNEISYLESDNIEVIKSHIKSVIYENEQI